MKNENSTCKINSRKRKYSEKDSIGSLMNFLMRIHRFTEKYLEEHPECQGCEFIEMADETMYKDLRELKCKRCPRYKGW